MGSCFTIAPALTPAVGRVRGGSNMLIPDIEPYRQAIRTRVCPICTESTTTGVCLRPPDDACALEDHLEEIVRAILETDPQKPIGDYIDSLRRTVCPGCREDPDGSCHRRESADCAADAYLIHLIRVVEDVAAGEQARAAR
jgi:hypothetical protein